MAEYTYHTKETAPEAAQAGIEKSLKGFGFLPNLHAVMAEAPAMLDAYHSLWDLFGASSLTPLEQQVVLMTANFENNCHYCVPGHTYIMKSQNMPDGVIQALRDGTPIADAKLEALRTFARELIENQGHVGDERLQVFLDAGYTKQQSLEVIVGLAMKVLSNYTNALAHTEVDGPVQKYAWTKPETIAS